MNEGDRHIKKEKKRAGETRGKDGRARKDDVTYEVN
jgi:hypothetical protein